MHSQEGAAASRLALAPAWAVAGLAHLRRCVLLFFTNSLAFTATMDPFGYFAAVDELPQKAPRSKYARDCSSAKVVRDTLTCVIEVLKGRYSRRRLIRIGDVRSAIEELESVWFAADPRRAIEFDSEAPHFYMRVGAPIVDLTCDEVLE